MNFFHTRETGADDEERSRRFVQGVADAYEARTGDAVNGGDLTDFETAILCAAFPPPGQPYPPAGHDYPWR